MKHIFFTAILSLICTALGLAGGLFVGLKKGQNFAAQQSPENSREKDQGRFSPTALENMGVKIQSAELTTFVRYETVPAVIEEIASSSLPIFSPISGHVESVCVEKNAVVQKESVLITIIRDALPKVKLTLTQDILKPATEDFHLALNDFRRTVKSLEILEQERTRLEKFSKGSQEGDFPLVSKTKLIEIVYEIEKTKYEVTLHQENLLRHGLTKEQIDLGKIGKLPQVDVQIWNQTLKHHGLWPPLADQIYETLPPEIQSLHWTMATIGELVATGLATQELLIWLKTEKKAGNFFLEIGGLLQRGQTLNKLQHIFELNGFDPVVKIVAPLASEDWDIDEILVRPHQSVKEGEKLLTLKNSKELYLVAQPEGSEKNIIVTALQEKRIVSALPLSGGEAPALEQLQLINILNEDKTGIMKAYIKVQNQSIHIHENESNNRFRTWALRKKQQFLLKIPVETMEKVYILPKGALTEQGTQKIVFLQNGNRFFPIEVNILYQDHENVVVSGAVDIFPGDPLVYQGAFSLGLALKSVNEEDAASHGHGH